MSSVADIAVFSTDHHLALVVEVKARRNATPQWAALLRRNLLAHDAVPDAPYFLIASLDRFFLWHNADKGLQSPPDYVAESNELVQRYASSEDPTALQWSDAELELAIVAWLHDVAAQGKVNARTQLGAMLQQSQLLTRNYVGIDHYASNRMIVYVESNFVFELAFQRGDHLAALRLLELAETGQVTLVIPAYSIGEPYEGMTRRSKARSVLHIRLEQELRELARSRPYANVLDVSTEVTQMLIASASDEKRRLDEALKSILDIAEVIPLDATVFRLSLQRRAEVRLSPQDSFVLASIEHHARQQPSIEKLFLTTNSADFLTSELENSLLDCRCKLMTRFAHGLAHVQSTLKD